MASSNVESSSSQPSTRHSTLASFKCSPLQNPRTQDVFQSIVKGRKSWKTLRGGEVVWPPELEAALIEGLENYQPDDSRETRLLGRFPMRNRFISDWIFEKTGKTRSAKQVGSRLQQLRDTCGGKRLLNLLSPIRRTFHPPPSPEFQHKDGHLTYGPPPLRYESESGSDSSLSAPPTPTEAHATLQNLLYRGVEVPRVEETPDTIIYIDILPDQSPVDGKIDIPPKTSLAQANEERSWIERGYKVTRASPHPRQLREIDPTITLISRTATTARSHYTVHTDDGIVYCESTDLEMLDPITNPTVDGTLLYKTPLIPGFWETISRSPDAAQYVIVQRVVQEASTSSASSTIFSAMYRFCYTSSSSHPQAQFCTSLLPVEPTTNHKTDFSLESLLSMDGDGFTDLMAFQKQPTYFELNNYMRSDWSSPSPSESVYSSPIDCNRLIPGIINGGVHSSLLSPTPFPMEEEPNYAF
ncbi:hypothetical protein M413DRAFT_448921 [Hebeloma cylindrosporum]|uniref:TEA domain-containing protein n=1 Tax=Hebeloma cylindrosporum TaxID=76867 RepID=A0A0C3BXJ4_HEBCY|nr:hypothetical protein M413DRAFT_448921 [Hebeloma cylindrosporum h7]